MNTFFNYLFGLAVIYALIKFKFEQHAAIESENDLQKNADILIAIVLILVVLFASTILSTALTRFYVLELLLDTVRSWGYTEVL